MRSVRIPSLDGDVKGALYREQIGIPGYHSKEVSARTYLSQLACVIAIANNPFRGQSLQSKPFKFTPAGWHSPSPWMDEARRAFFNDTSTRRDALKSLCARTGPPPKESYVYVTHNLEASLFRMRKRHEPDTLRDILHPLPPKYPQLC